MKAYETMADLIAQLKTVVFVGGPDYVKDFEQLVSKIAAIGDESSISELAQFLDDAQRDELMFSLVHAIERFDDKTYLKNLLRIAPDLCNRVPGWASILFMRVLNNQSAQHELVRQLRFASSETRESVKSLMARINGLSPKFLSKTVPVLAAVEGAESP